MDAREFFDLVRDFFGDKVLDEMVDTAGPTYWCTLYESFRLTCGLNEQYGQFTGGIAAGSDEYFTTFFGEGFSRNSDRESILENLRMVDEWCRLRLPDKFLERYEAALGIDAS
jgi:hypothetical protein